MFKSLYQWAADLAARKAAIAWLQFFSFIESVFFPVPTDVVLVPVVLKHREQALKIAVLTTLFSVLGGAVGYAAGHYGLDLVYPYIEQFHMVDKWDRVVQLFEQYGVLVIIVVGFTPLPYKVVTLASGATGVGFVLFILTSIVGRFGRFGLVSWVVYKFGPQAEAMIEKYVEPLGWLVVGLVVAWIGWTYL